MPKISSEWWEKTSSVSADSAIRFECQGSGKCCVSREEYGYVYLTSEDRKRLARHLKIQTAVFTKKHCSKTEGYFHLKGGPQVAACPFLLNKKCSVYEARPTQCRTWPFWPEVMSAKTWKKEVASYCPGVGKGPVISVEEIRRNLRAQEKSEEKL